MKKALVNKKVRQDYEVKETLTAGIALLGSEVKSLRMGQGSLVGARVMAKNDELWLVGMNIGKYRFDGREGYEAMRERKLLVNKKEARELFKKSKGAGLTLVPLRVYNKGRLIKVEIGLVRGKRKFEKRETLKKRAQKRDIQRKLKKIK